MVKLAEAVGVDTIDYVDAAPFVCAEARSLTDASTVDRSFQLEGSLVLGIEQTRP